MTLKLSKSTVNKKQPLNHLFKAISASMWTGVQVWFADLNRRPQFCRIGRIRWGIPIGGRR
jgi:hypothetical protein